MAKLKYPTPLFLGFAQATGIFVYILAVSYFIFNINNFVSNVPSFLAPTLLLTLFVSSALVTSLTAFYHPVNLFFIKNKKKRALQIIAATSVFLIFYTISVVSFLVYFS